MPTDIIELSSRQEMTTITNQSEEDKSKSKSQSSTSSNDSDSLVSCQFVVLVNGNSEKSRMSDSRHMSEDQILEVGRDGDGNAMKYLTTPALNLNIHYDLLDQFSQVS
jgi:hypothetical protein